MSDIIRREFDFFTVEAKKDACHVDFWERFIGAKLTSVFKKKENAYHSSSE